MKNLAIFITSCFLFFSSFVAVSAEEITECTTSTGSYGQTSTTCQVLGTTHETVNAGIADINLFLVAGILSVVGLGTFSLAKLAERTYWFD